MFRKAINVEILELTKPLKRKYKTFINDPNYRTGQEGF
jgi:hypothetical protein